MMYAPCRQHACKGLLAFLGEAGFTLNMSRKMGAAAGFFFKEKQLAFRT